MSAPEDTSHLSGAWKLLGRTLNDGWHVLEPYGWKPGEEYEAIYPQRAGRFSVGYIVEKDSARAYLKAIDYGMAMSADDSLTAIQDMVDATAFERDLLKICSAARLNKVVLAVSSGEITTGPNLQDRAPYIIFELAEGNVRSRIRQIDGSVRTVWFLRALHNAATGLKQLHSKDIAHLDLKPSNLLDFSEDKVFKVADLGRSLHREKNAPHENFALAGDPTYGPPEQLYGYKHPEWEIRRLSCDLYLLGSMIAFFLTGYGATPLLFDKIEVDLKPRPWGGWTGTYEEVLPRVRHAFTEVVEQIRGLAPDSFGDQIANAFSELCDPDPLLRGHPLDRAKRSGNPYGLVRYISLFDLLSRKSAIDNRANPTS